MDASPNHFPKAIAWTHVALTRSWIHLLKWSSGWLPGSLQRCSSPGQINCQIFACCIAALNGCAAYFAPLLRRSSFAGGFLGTRFSRACSETPGCTSSSSATVLRPRIHICAIRNEDKYYQMQPETLLRICVGAQKLCNSTRAPSPTHRGARLEGEEPCSSWGNSEVRGQGGE